MKYGKSIEDILSVLDDKKQKLSEYENYDEVVAARKAEYDRAYKKLMNAASLLSSQRKKTALNFSQDIINALKQPIVKYEWDTLSKQKA